MVLASITFTMEMSRLDYFAVYIQMLVQVSGTRIEVNDRLEVVVELFGLIKITGTVMRIKVTFTPLLLGFYCGFLIMFEEAGKMRTIERVFEFNKYTNVTTRESAFLLESFSMCDLRTWSHLRRYIQ